MKLPAIPLEARVVAVHDQACASGESMYCDPATGLWTLTADALRDRGFCCGEGCRHCPWADTSAEHPNRANNLRRKITRLPGSEA